MSWLSRLNPRGPGSRSGRTAAPLSPCTADPETCLMVFKNHWRQVSWVLDQRESLSSSDDLTAVRNNTDQMLCLLAEERPAESSEGGFGVASMGPILELVITENILERLVQWHLCRGLDPDSQGALLKLFEMLIGQSQQPLLQHTAVLHPLLRLLGACADPELGCPLALENSLVLLLNQVCVSMARQPMILELLFRASPAQQGSTNLLIFSLLVPFIHRDGAIGQQARDALLLVMAASASHESAARYIAENSYFCPVLATGLSALYSSLPRKIEVRGDDWHALRREDWMGVSSLVLFMNSLEFCNAVVQVAHPTVSSQLLDYLHNGFLVPVMGPALHKSSVDEMIASTAYLDLFLRSITETSLLKTFLRFILLHRHDNDTILDTLLIRISSNSRLCMVSLSLFRTLLSLNCEDVMLQLIFRYLLPCTHVMLSQRRAIRETDMYGKCADKFLSLIPECCRQYTAASSERDEDNPFWSKDPDSSTIFRLPPRPSTPSRLSLFMRQHTGGGGSGGGNLSSSTSLESLQSGPSGSRPLSPDSPMHQHGHTDCLDWDAGFLEYLKDARRGIEVCSWACRDWSAPYDGENPSPNTAPPPPPPPTSNPSMAMFPEHFSFHQGVSSSTPPGHTCSDPPETNPSQQSVESLLEELLEQAPGDPQMSADANGQGISIEAFTLELRKLEDRVKERSRPACKQEPSAAETLPAEQQEEDEQLPTAPEAKGDASVMGAPSPARPVNQPTSQPYTGPFMVVLFAKLENMLQNSLYVNILLTGIVAQLACYPQPLLRSFLLNTNMVFQPSVKSLIQVLGSVKNRIEAFAASHEDFPVMLRKAQQYLVARGKLDWTDLTAAVPTLRRSESLVKSRKPSLGDLILRHTNSPTRARNAAQLALAHVRDGGQSLHSALFRGGGGSGGGGASGLEKQAEALRVKNAVYCTVIFCEFLKELAALAQEHAVTLPFPQSKEEEPRSGRAPLPVL
uniref:FHF complex subunit HOOK-interacting protein 1B n=1 Tax=Oryzias sinensis TaxID=183150 RepID=A0A8C7XVE4_9TELE